MNFTPRTYSQHLSMVPSPNQVPTLGLPRPSCVHGPSSWSPKRLWSPDHQVSRSPLPEWWKKHPIIRPMSLFLESQFNKEWLFGFLFLRILNQNKKSIQQCLAGRLITASSFIFLQFDIERMSQRHINYFSRKTRIKNQQTPYTNVSHRWSHFPFTKLEGS